MSELAIAVFWIGVGAVLIRLVDHLRGFETVKRVK